MPSDVKDFEKHDKAGVALTTEPIVRLENVSKIFVTDELETHALNKIHMELYPGEFIAITGPSGCGKSTLLSIIGLLDTPTDGNYYFEGQKIAHTTLTGHNKTRNRNFGFIFQAFNLIGDLTVYENVELPLIYRNTPVAKRKSQVIGALECVEMSHRLKHFPIQLSGGQQQRVAVARAIVGNPLILLADEPTGNLDSHNSAAIMRILRETQRAGTTICMVTHDERYTKYAERILHMFDGRIVEESRT
ncbi:ABC transporter ATP-binding protein [bacterium]|nr:ABC transporter ATP-binding protein [candidate division CSSED10-310 bacterium]